MSGKPSRNMLKTHSVWKGPSKGFRSEGISLRKGKIMVAKKPRLVWNGKKILIERRRLKEKFEEKAVNKTARELYVEGTASDRNTLSKRSNRHRNYKHPSSHIKEEVNKINELLEIMQQAKNIKEPEKLKLKTELIKLLKKLKVPIEVAKEIGIKKKDFRF